MSYQSIPNLIAHEIQIAESIHLSHASRFHIERLVMEAIRDENQTLIKEKEYWRQLCRNKSNDMSDNYENIGKRR